MDLVLGVSVMGDYGRMALVDASAGTVIDKYDLDLSADEAETLVETIINTDRGLTEDGHRLVGTRVAASDVVLGNDVRDELSHAGLAGVTLVAPLDAAAAFVRTLASLASERTSALLFVSGYTATLSVVGVDEATTNLIAAEPVGEDAPRAALSRLLDRLTRHPIGAQSIYLVGASDDLAPLTGTLTTPIPFRATDRVAYAVALGAAMAAAAMVGPSGVVPGVRPHIATTPIPTTMLSPQSGQKLASSAAERTAPREVVPGPGLPDDRPHPLAERNESHAYRDATVYANLAAAAVTTGAPVVPTEAAPAVEATPPQDEAPAETIDPPTTAVPVVEAPLEDEEPEEVEADEVEPDEVEPEAAVEEPAANEEAIAETVAVPVANPEAHGVKTPTWLVLPKSDEERAKIAAAAEAAAALEAAEKAKPKPKTKKVKTKKVAEATEGVLAEASVEKPKAKKKKAAKKDSDAAEESQPTVVLPLAAAADVDADAETVAAAPAARKPRMLLVGSSLAAAAAVVFVVLAAGLAIGIKPTASQQAVRDYESVPGKYLPIMPGQSSALVSDREYVPQVVQVGDKAPPSDGSTSGPSGGYPTLAQAPGQVVVSTKDAPPPPLALPPGFGTDLRDWLPAGMGDNLSELFPDAAACTPGDAACFVKATGCQPGDVACLNAIYAACKAGLPTCKGTPIAQPHQLPTTATSVCPGPGTDCVPPEFALCAPNDPACAAVPLGALPGECPPGTACEPPPAVNPNDHLGATPAPAAPPTEASAPPTSAPPTSTSEPEPSPPPSPSASPSTTTVEPPPPPPPPPPSESVAPSEPSPAATSEPPVVHHGGT